MIEIISGEKGKGKTKELLGRVNSSVDSVSGNIVYLDKSQKHMYELKNKVRLINVMDYLIDTCDEFLGFICGIQKLDAISEKFNVKFVLSVSRDESKLTDVAKAKIVVSL